MPTFGQDASFVNDFVNLFGIDDNEFRNLDDFAISSDLQEFIDNDFGGGFGSFSSFSQLGGSGDLFSAVSSALLGGPLAEAVGPGGDASGFDFSITIVDALGNPIDLQADFGAALIEAVTQTALLRWGEFINGAEGAVLDIQLTIDSLAPGTVASAGPATFAFTGEFEDLDEDGDFSAGDIAEVQANTAFELITGTDINGAAPDLFINVNADILDAGTFFIDATTLEGDVVPAGTFDLFSVLLHEILHGLGFLSLRESDVTDPDFFELPFGDFIGAGFDFSVATAYDLAQEIGPDLGDGSTNIIFTGENVVEAYGEAVRLESNTGSAGSDFSHFNGSQAGDLSSANTLLALENPFVIPGDRVDVGLLELAVLADLGYDVSIPDDLRLVQDFDALTALFEADNGFDQPVFSTSDITIDGNVLTLPVSAQSLFGAIANSVGIEISGNGASESQRVEVGNFGAPLEIDIEFDSELLVSEDELENFVGTRDISIDVRLFNPTIAVLSNGTNEETVTFNIGQLIGGTDEDDVLDGGDGDDTILGRGGDDTINGGAGNDDIDGGDGNDILNGNGDDDTIDGGAGADTIDGGAGDDFAEGGAGNDTILGNIGDDVLYGGAGNDTISGGNGADDLIGGGGADTLNGDGGDDFIDGGNSADIIDGGAGADTILGGGGADTINGGTSGDFIDGGGAGDVIHGDGGDDVLLGGAGAGEDTLYGGDGDDFLDGGAGVDNLIGGAGDDIIVYTGEDVIDGGDGVDSLQFADAEEGLFIDLDTEDDLDTSSDASEIDFAALSIEGVVGTDFGDELFGSADDNFFDGGAGDDLIHGQDGDDVLIGGAGIDTVYGGDGDDEIDGLDGLADMLIGGAGNDGFFADANDVVNGGDGVDLVDFSSLASGLGGGVFSGIIVDLDINSAGMAGMPSQDGAVLSLPPAAGGMPVFGTNLIDVEAVIGSEFNDGLFGNNEANFLNGAGGNDIIHGFGGADFLAGGDGIDTVVFAAASAGVTIDLNNQVDAETIEAAAIDSLTNGVAFTGPFAAGPNVLSGFENVTATNFDDTVEGDDADNFINALAGDDTIDGNAGVDNINGGDGDDTLLGGSDDDQIFGGEGDDTIDGGLDDDALFGDAGNDTINGNTGDDTISGGAGNDTITGDNGADALFGEGGADTISGGNGDDLIDGGNSADTINGDAGDDELFGGGGADTVMGGTGNDTIDGGGAGDTLHGGEGDDDISGGAGSGEDTLYGGAGNDTLTGGAGADTFVFSADFGEDTITDYEVGVDVIDASAVGAGTVFSGLNEDGDLVLIFDGATDNSITLVGITDIDDVTIDLGGAAMADAGLSLGDDDAFDFAPADDSSVVAEAAPDFGLDGFEAEAGVVIAPSIPVGLEAAIDFDFGISLQRDDFDNTFDFVA